MVKRSRWDSNPRASCAKEARCTGSSFGGCYREERRTTERKVWSLSTWLPGTVSVNTFFVHRASEATVRTTAAQPLNAAHLCIFEPGWVAQNMMVGCSSLLIIPRTLNSVPSAVIAQGARYVGVSAIDQLTITPFRRQQLGIVFASASISSRGPHTDSLDRGSDEVLTRWPPEK